MSPACGSGHAPGRGPLPSPCSLGAHRPSQDGAPRVLPTSTPATWCRRSRLVDTQAASSQQCSEDQAEQETGLSEAGRAHRALPTEQAEPRTGAHCPPTGEPAIAPKGSGWAYRHFSSCTWVSCPKMRGLGQVRGKVSGRRKSPGPRNGSFVSLVGESPLSMEGRPGCRPVRARRACAPASLPEAALRCPPSPPGSGGRRGQMRAGPHPAAVSGLSSPVVRACVLSPHPRLPSPS